MNENKSNSSNNVRSIQRALNILLCFDWDNRSLTATDIAKKMNLAKSTTARLLNTLETEGFLTRDESTNLYKLGHQLYYLGMLAEKDFDIKEVSYPIMEDIRNKTQETVSLYLLNDLKKICIAQVESERSIKQSSIIGEKQPIWLGASGNAMLAFMDEIFWDQVKHNVQPLTKKTIVDEIAFIHNLKKIQHNLYAVSVGELYDEVGCVSSPIFGVANRVIGSLSVSGPQYRFPADTDYIGSLVVDGARKISELMGCSEMIPLNHEIFSKFV